MLFTLHDNRLTFIINSTVVDDDALRRISEQVKRLLDDPDAFPPGVSTTTVFQAVPTTVTALDIQTSTVTATVTVSRTRIIVPTATFRPSRSINQILSTASPGSNSFSMIPTPTPFTLPPASVSGLSLLGSSLTPIGFSSSISTSSPSTTSTDPLSTTSASSAASSFPPTPPAGKKRLPPGSIIGIVLACLVFFLFLVIYFVRWRLKRQRTRRRSWITPFVAEKPVLRVSVTQRQEKRMEFIAERWQRMRNSRRNRRTANANGAPGAPSSRENPRNREAGPVPASPSVYPEPSAGHPVQGALVLSLFPNGAVAKLKFEPRKRDELLARPGDLLKVLTLFNDGWALCKNSFGEKGMVPTSCLRANRVGRMGQG